MQQYDPMTDFYQRGIAFLFKQGATVAVSVLFLGITLAAVRLMWGKIERMETAFEVRIEKNNIEWNKALEIAREDWRQCEQKREALAIEVEKLKLIISKR